MVASFSTERGKFNVKTFPLYGKKAVIFLPHATEEQRKKAYSNLVIRPLDYIPGQGAHNFEIASPDSTSYLLFGSDSERFAKHKTWQVISNLRREEQKKD